MDRDIKYSNWETLGMFLVNAAEGPPDKTTIEAYEIQYFLVPWSEGDWDELDEDWPEWKAFVEQLEGEKET